MRPSARRRGQPEPGRSRPTAAPHLWATAYNPRDRGGRTRAWVCGPDSRTRRLCALPRAWTQDVGERPAAGGHLHLECRSHRAEERMSHRRTVPLLLLYTNTLHWCGCSSAAVITSVSSSMFAGLMSTMSARAVKAGAGRLWWEGPHGGLGHSLSLSLPRAPLLLPLRTLRSLHTDHTDLVTSVRSAGRHPPAQKCHTLPPSNHTRPPEFQKTLLPHLCCEQIEGALEVLTDTVSAHLCSTLCRRGGI